MRSSTNSRTRACLVAASRAVHGFQPIKDYGHKHEMTTLTDSPNENLKHELNFTWFGTRRPTPCNADMLGWDYPVVIDNLAKRLND